MLPSDGTPGQRSPRSGPVNPLVRFPYMNALSRFFYVVVALLAAMAMPFALNIALSAWHARNNAAAELLPARQIQASLAEYRDKVTRYNEFVNLTRSFVASARKEEIVPQNWVRYEVDVNNLPVTALEMRVMLENASASRRGGAFFFLPKLLEIQNLAAMSEEKIGLLVNKKNKVEPGVHALITLHGTFLVRR